MQLELNDEQSEILRQILGSYLSDMSYEIADTDDYDYRQNLKRRRDSVGVIVEALGPEA